MQINYHSYLTKIQKLQNFKKKKKKKRLFPVQAGIARNWPVWLVHGRYGRYLNQYNTLVFLYRYTYQYGWYRYNIDYLVYDSYASLKDRAIHWPWGAMAHRHIYLKF